VVFRQFLTAIRRRPLIALAGCVLTVVLTVLVHQRPGVHFTDVNAILLNPPTKAKAKAVQPGRAAVADVPVNPLNDTDPALVRAAGVVARVLDQGGSTSRSGSDSVSLVGQGVKHGFSVTLPNSGGQWVYRFERPVLNVQVVGRTDEEVQARLRTAMTEIRTTLQAQQRATGAGQDQWIRVLQYPTRPVIIDGRGDRRRAAAVTFALGLLVTLTMVQILQDRNGLILRSVRRVGRIGRR
jgi:hypothetical protein